MSVVIFIIAVTIGYLLYSSYKRESSSPSKEKKLSRNSSLDSDLDIVNTCTIPGCKCTDQNSYFHAFMRTLNKNYRDAHELIHAKPSPFQFHAFEDRFKTLEDVTEAIHASGLEQCRLVIGIDFTASNEWQGRSTNKGHSLHHVSSRPNIMNPYQHVISILSRTMPKLMSPASLEPFLTGRSSLRRKEPTMQCIHAYGFGDSVTKDKETFPLNPAYVPCSSFNEVQQFYKDASERVILDGPTSYAPVINKAIEIVEENNKKFHILIIIADGQFVDEGPTAEAIINASNHPLSIVVVGVGDGPWGLLKRFDDWLPQRQFDNFQFVEYNKVLKEFGGRHSDTALALHVLMEIPDQFKTVQQLGFFERPPKQETPTGYEANLDPNIVK